MLGWIAFDYWPVTVHVGHKPKQFSIQMPRKDKRKLEFFFREMCFLEGWAYTLWGSKPVSIDNYTEPKEVIRQNLKYDTLKTKILGCFWPPNWGIICYVCNPTQLKIKNGWNTLNKYSYLVDKSQFALFSDCCDNATVSMTLVNKTALHNIVSIHFKEFQPTLEKLSMDLDSLSDSQKLDTFLLETSLHDNLIGILLGYGKDNAHLFNENKIHAETQQFSNESTPWPMSSAWPEEEMENLDHLNQKIFTFKQWDLDDLFYPRFVCDLQSQESQHLKHKYREDRAKILEYYRGKDVVEASLTLLIAKSDS